MNSFPPLIPVPVASKSDAEEKLEEKFATLFQPPTPRASPVPFSPIFRPPPRPVEDIQHQTSHSPDSEFGPFISVPAFEDPLGPALSINAPSSSRPIHVKNPSLSFFDSFAQEAKAANERNKRGVMDELLFEDNQLKFPDPLPRNDYTADVNPDSLLDLDMDFFTPKQESSAAVDDFIFHHTSSSSPQLPTRKSTLSLPQGPVPPIASTSPVSSTPPPDHYSDNDSMTDRSPSYQTLSNISSRWMSSLLKSSSADNPESEHLSHSATISSSSTHSRSPSTPDSRIHSRHTTTFPLPSSFSTSAIGSHQTLHGLHSSPFAPHVFVAPSGAPGFKPDVYDWDKGFSRDLDRELAADRELLPTGKHMNGSLDVPGTSISRHNSPVEGLPLPRSKAHSRSQTPSPIGIGGLIEKKTGNLALKGRKEATTAVLNVTLAEMIRAHLPALSRFPRAWNLLYSIDQHGISLHTLYDKCENQAHLKTNSGLVTKVGALVVIKDSEDAIFGAYIGDGLRKSMGKGYYGSGESFLWRYVNGNFQVFKWTGKNDYVALCEPEYLSFGGGDGVYGLYLNDTLFDGSSARCPTFDNDPLCSLGEKKGRAVSFECVGLEVWGLGP